MTPMAETILYASIRILVVAVAVAMILAVARVRSGALRHAAWTAVLGAMLLMPVLPDLVPRVAVAVPMIVPVPPNMALEVGSSALSAKVTPRVPQSPVSIPAAQRIDWLSIAYMAYGSVTAFLLLRLARGWQYARRLRTSGTLVPELDGVYESAVIRVPMTIGLLRPRVTLPITWRDWPDAKLRAVLAHECEHVRRGDSLIGMAAHLNRCLFWFHPLAWWLERAIAASAEQACDEAGVEALGDARGYAEVLLGLAEEVRGSGRFSWQALGMAGTGRIGERIDRVLRGEARSASRRQKSLVAASCLAAVLLAAGCQQKARQLITNREMAQRALVSEMRTILMKVAAMLTAQQAAELEKQLVQTPDDLDIHTKLLVFYGRHVTEQTLELRRAQVLWFIQHHPEDETVLAGRISPSSSDPLPDANGYAQAKKLWLQKTGDAQRDPAVLMNAASFLKVADKPLAEQLLIRASELESQNTEAIAVESATGQSSIRIRTTSPKGMAAILLGRLYYEALVGSNALMPMGVVRSVSLTDVHGTYANEVRQKLATATNPVVLASTGDMLVTWGRNLTARRDVDFDAVALGKSYVERALQLDPQNRNAHRTLAYLHRIERSAPLDQAFREKRLQEYVASSTGMERCYALYKMAESEYVRFKEKNTRPNDQLEHAKQMAEESLKLAASFRNEPDYGDVIYSDNMLLGMIAMYHGQRKEAVKYMHTAAEAPSTEELAYLQGILTLELPGWLLKDGERQSVIDFLERFAKTNISERALLLDSAAAIRNGMRPTWYRD